MSEEKRNKITVAVTINAVLLVFILFAVVIAQIVTMGILKNRENQIHEEYEAIQQEYDESKELLDRLTEDEKFRKSMAELYMLGDFKP